MGSAGKDLSLIAAFLVIIGTFITAIQEDGNTIIVQAGEYTRYLGRLDIYLTKDESGNYTKFKRTVDGLNASGIYLYAPTNMAFKSEIKIQKKYS